jgi:hypothetical protein
MASFGEFTNEYLNKEKKKQKQSFSDFTNDYLNKQSQDIAPITTTEETEKRTGLFKAGAFADGFDILDIPKAMFASSADLTIGAWEGAGNMVEGLTDLVLYGTAGVSDLFGADDFAEKTKKLAEKNSVSDLIGGIREKTGIKDSSLYGDFGYGVAQGLGQVATVIATGGIAGAAGASGAVVNAITTGTMGLSSMGSGMSEAYQGGATDEEAWAYGAMKGAVDAGTELIFAGLGKGFKALGYSKGLTSIDDVVAKKVSSKISNQFFKNATEYGIKATAEGVEELLAGLGSAAAKKLTYMSDEELGQLIEDENLLEQFATGVIVSGIAQGGDFMSSTAGGRDFISGLTANEQKVAQAEFERRVAAEEQSGKKLNKKQKNEIYDEVIEELQKGGISTDTIGEMFGGEDYKAYKSILEQEKPLRDEIKSIMDNDTLSDEQKKILIKDVEAKLEALAKETNRSEVEEKYRNTINSQFVRKNGKQTQTDDYLLESYNEDARRGQYFEVDLDKYDGKAKEFMQKLMDSKLANNTRRSHEYFDLAAKVVGDQDMDIDVVDNKKMLELIKKKKGDKFDASAYKGKIVNGFAIDGGIAINVESAKALSSLVGHEITHSFEKSKSYEKLKNAALQYARTKGVYESLFEEQKAMYEGIYANDESFTEKVDREVVSEVVGDYLFTDPEFISHLSTKHRNVFLKVFDEIKYLCKVATKGSKEARQLEKVKRAFEKAYRENIQGETKATAPAKASAKVDSNVENNVANEDVSPIAEEDIAPITEDVTEEIVDEEVAKEVDEETELSAEDEVLEEADEDTEIKEADQERWDRILDAKYDEEWWISTFPKTVALYRYSDMTNKEALFSVLESSKEVKAYDKRPTAKNKQRYEDFLNEVKRKLYDHYEGQDTTTLPKTEMATLKERIDRLDAIEPMEADVEWWKNEYPDVSFKNDNVTNRDFLYDVWGNTEEYKTRFDTRYEDPHFEEIEDAYIEVLRKIQDNLLDHYKDYDLDSAKIAESTKNANETVFGEAVGTENVAEATELYTDVENTTRIKKQLKKTSDKDYLDAVERGDTETAQRMVDEAAKEAGYTEKVYHGTNNFGFTKIDLSKTDNGIALFTSDTEETAGTYSQNEKIRQISDKDGRSGIYEMYANTDNLLEIECNGAYWNKIKAEGLPEGIRTTEQVAHYAKDEGYSGVKFKNLRDGGSKQEIPPATVYAFFDPQTQVKSADTVTYDDKGNVIPLSERFNTENDDIRYSINQEYMKAVERGDTEAAQRMVDEAAKKAGYLPVTRYHQTGKKFTRFSNENPDAALNDSDTPNGYFFKDNDHDIGVGADFVKTGHGGSIQMPVYLKHNNLLYFENREVAQKWYSTNVPGYGEILRKYNEHLNEYKRIDKENTAKMFDELNALVEKGEDTPDKEMAVVDKYDKIIDDWIASNEEYETSLRAQMRQLLNEHFIENDSGYDGIELADDGHRYIDGKREDVHTYIVFKNTQIKSADTVTYDDNGNVIPLSERFNTENDDIRYSISTEREPMPKTRVTVDPTKMNLQKDLKTVRAVRTNTMLKNGYTTEDVDEVNRFMDNLADFMEKAGVTYKFIGLEDVNNAKLKVTYDKNGNPKKVTMSAMVKNGEYPINFDFTRICKKRESMSMVIKELAKRQTADGRRTIDTVNLDAKALWTINEELRKAGLETACLGCFVESKRYNIQAFADKAVNMWNSIVDEVRQENGAVGEAESFNFAEGINLDRVDYGAIEKIFADYQTVKGRSSPEARMRALIQNGGELFQRYLKPSDLMTPEGIESIKAMSTKKNDFYGILKGVYGQAAPKEVMGFSPYNSEVALLPKNKNGKKLSEYVASIGGVRMQSFSDFLVANVYDYMQMVADLSARHLPAHAYTKEIAFAKIFGMTGIKINMSVMFDIDANLPGEYAGLQFVADENGDEYYEGVKGRWEYLVGDKNRSDATYEATGERPYVQSIGFDEAVALQNDPRYSKNCGIIGVGMSDRHILKMLGDDRIRYIIPYHSSSLPAVIAEVTNIKMATDYTDFQNTRKITSITDANGNAVDLKALREQCNSWSEVYSLLQENIALAGWKVETESDSKLAGRGGFDIYKDVEATKNPKQSAENYLQYCAENNYMPVFEQFAFHENYYKLLYDFDPYDSVTGEYSPQTEVKNIYSGYNPSEGLTSTETVQKIIDDEMAKQNEINKARNEAMPSVVNNVLEQLGVEHNEVGVSTGDMAQSISWEGETPVRRHRSDVFGKDIMYEAPIGDIAPIREDIAKNATTTSEVPMVDASEDIDPANENTEAQPIKAIKTVSSRLTVQLNNSKTELEKNEANRQSSMESFDEQIKKLETEYESKSNKNTQAANNLLIRIERLKRSKANVDAKYEKAINDNKKRIRRLEDELAKDHSNADRIQAAYARIDQQLEQDKADLKAEYEAKKSAYEAEAADKSIYISRRAKELYDELRGLKKGVRASSELGYLLDLGYDWNTLKSTLLKVSKWSDEVINPDSVEESAVREMLNEEFADKGYRIAELDDEYQEKISELENKADEEKSHVRRATQKSIKMKELAEWAENLIGNTVNWVDKKLGIQYSMNTERRNLRDIVRGEDGKIDTDKADSINDALNGEYNREEAEKNRELTERRDKYAKLKITKAEDAYIQMLGEVRYNPDTTLTQESVAEYYEKNKQKIDTEKVDKVIEMARKDYDDWFERVNAVLREYGMAEIPYRKGYFPHFTDTKQNFFQKLFNWKTQNNEIPTSIAGLTEEFKPVRSWQPFNKQRKGDSTDYSFSKGFDAYSEGVLDWIYHLGTIQKRRAVENYIRYTHSDAGIKARIDAVYESETLDADEAQAQIDAILAEANNPLNNFIQDFTTHTNILAGKKNSLDRTVEQMTNRQIYSTMTNVQNRISANMVLANVRSALTNFIPITQSWAQVSPIRSLQATKDTIANAIKDDGLVNKSTFLTNRLKTPDNLHNTTWDKVLDKAGIMFEIVDNFSSQVIWRSKYNQNLAKGMTESQAIKNADQFAENVMAGRSKGNEPTLFNAKNPLVKAFTMFQLEVNNQYGYLFKDVPNDLKAETNHWKLNLAKGYTTAFIGAYIYNEILSQLTGSDAALDPIGIIKDLLRDLGLFDDDEEKEPAKVATNLIDNVVEELPFVGGFFGGGRIPISSAIPYSDDGLSVAIEDISEGNWKNVGKEMMNPILNVAFPVGGGQVKKTVQGLRMFDEDHPISGSYTSGGDLRYPVEDTLGNRVQAALFGQYANKNAREYFDNDFAPIRKDQIGSFVESNASISEYRENKDEYTFAHKYPEKYLVAKAIGGYTTYKDFTDDLNDIKSSKDFSGESISGSRKQKVADYINGLDADYGEKIIMFKVAYPSDDTYNGEILEYLNSRNDISFDEKKTILKELGFTVGSDGRVTW